MLSTGGSLADGLMQSRASMARRPGPKVHHGRLASSHLHRRKTLLTAALVVRTSAAPRPWWRRSRSAVVAVRPSSLRRNAAKTSVSSAPPCASQLQGSSFEEASVALGVPDDAKLVALPIVVDARERDDRGIAVFDLVDEPAQILNLAEIAGSRQLRMCRSCVVQPDQAQRSAMRRTRGGTNLPNRPPKGNRNNRGAEVPSFRRRPRWPRPRSFDANSRVPKRFCEPRGRWLGGTSDYLPRFHELLTELARSTADGERRRQRGHSWPVPPSARSTPRSPKLREFLALNAPIAQRRDLSAWDVLADGEDSNSRYPIGPKLQGFGSADKQGSVAKPLICRVSG
jgi:hypothetical protein